MGPTPTSVLVKEEMIYPVVVKSDSKCRIGSVSVADNLSTCKFSVSTLIFEALRASKISVDTELLVGLG